MPDGQVSTLLNRKPVYVGDDTALNSIQFPGSAAGQCIKGSTQRVISGEGATRTLLANESGALCYFDRAAGIVYTLPSPVVGLTFEFIVSTTVTSNAHKIITSAGTVFLIGNVLQATAATTPSANDGPKLFSGNGSSHVAVSTNGSTTGGILGGYYRFRCVSATLWIVDGIATTTGVSATPFANS